MLRTLLTRRAGRPGTKKLMRRYGPNLLCVRYRYDDEEHERLKTVEIVVERVRWRRREKEGTSDSVHVRIEPHEDLLRRAVLFAGGRWNEESDTWQIQQQSARALGLSSRIQRARRTRKNRSTIGSTRNDPDADRSDHG